MINNLEKIVIQKIGPYHESWALVYLDPNSSYSAGGGRITIVLDDYVGSAFFSHVGQPTFKEFITQCDAPYLLSKVFKTPKWVPVLDGNEFIAAIWRERSYQIKTLRKEDDYSLFSKTKLRKLYEELKDSEFESISHLYDSLESSHKESLAEIFQSSDWWWDSPPCKLNHVYEFQESMLEGIIAEFKKLAEVNS
ncbi:hypothetical protein [Acinetobacter soli]|uniref:hypothetical protein n=1 Tax=Acinetobacter soli TaxID=487316 RepID=UPI0012508341|nr:hypothetical protein [Acinetobacter soli]